MIMQDAFGEVLSRALDQVLASNPENQKVLAPLEGKWIALTLTDLPIHGLIGYHDAQMIVRPFDQSVDVDATLSGRSVDIFLMAVSSRRGGGHHAPQGIQMRGDVACAMAWRQVLSEVDVPLDRLVARHLGEGPAYGLGACVQAVRGGMRRIFGFIERQSVGLVRDEMGVVVTQAEVEAFSARVTDCRERLARLEQICNRRSPQSED